MDGLQRAGVGWLVGWCALLWVSGMAERWLDDRLERWLVMAMACGSEASSTRAESNNQREGKGTTMTRRSKEQARRREQEARQARHLSGTTIL